MAENTVKLHDENIAALGFLIATHATSEQLYLTPAGRDNGMAGVYAWCAELGEAFTEAEALCDPDYLAVDWYLALDAFVLAVWAEENKHASKRELIVLADIARRGTMEEANAPGYGGSHG